MTTIITTITFHDSHFKGKILSVVIAQKLEYQHFKRNEKNVKELFLILTFLAQKII